MQILCPTLRLKIFSAILVHYKLLKDAMQGAIDFLYVSAKSVEREIHNSDFFIKIQINKLARSY